MQYTQDALFPETEAVGTGQPVPWPQLDEMPEQAPAAPKPFKIERLGDQLPFEDAA
ncbi:hypothetical protein AB0D56_09725 [Streptomyces sp. NPDC048209]|uniref:hypothetical protein n=1 Tax=Streptomyces sp. NPDC048209 TaxID=3156689 RepID=UPI00342CEBC7